MRSQCNGCGKSIIWAFTESGGKIPIDSKPLIYRLDERDDGEIVARKADGIFGVSHFVTCPKANDFSGSKKP